MNAKQIVDKYMIERELESAVNLLKATRIHFDDGQPHIAKKILREAMRKCDTVENLLIEYGADND